MIGHVFTHEAVGPTTPTGPSKLACRVCGGNAFHTPTTHQPQPVWMGADGRPVPEVVKTPAPTTASIPETMDDNYGAIAAWPSDEGAPPPDDRDYDRWLGEAQDDELEESR